MREWIRSHLTYANVMVTILAFLVLGGGTAVAAFVVSSNSQIAPGTVSGHKPPSGKHPNVIPGSINAEDLAAGAVSTGKLHAAAVTNPKLADASVSNKKLKIGAVGPAKLADGAVTGSKLDNNAITAAKLGLISHTEFSPFDSSSPKSLSAACPVGTTVVAGSATVDDGSGGDPGPVALASNGLQLFLDGWHARAYETTAIATQWELVVTTICVRE